MTKPVFRCKLCAQKESTSQETTRSGYCTPSFRPPDYPPVTEADAENYLAADMAAALAATLRYCPVLLIQPENRLAAIVDFTFNLGVGRLQTSTLRRRINLMDWAGAALELRKWVHGGGRVLPGLVARRQAEIALMNQSI